MASILNVDKIRRAAGTSDAITIGSSDDVTIPSLISTGLDLTGQTGAVLQEVTAISKTFSTHNSTSWSESHSSYRVSITPKSSSSQIVLQYYVPYNPTGAANILHGFKAVRSTDGDTTFTDGIWGWGNALGSRQRISGGFTRSSNGYDANDMNMQNWISVDRPGVTTACIYGFHMKSEGTNSCLINHTNGNNSTWGWTSAVVIRATEMVV
jgi:hypothetical protein